MHGDVRNTWISSVGETRKDIDIDGRIILKWNLKT
jgi:hypothetical protein